MGKFATWIDKETLQDLYKKHTCEEIGAKHNKSYYAVLRQLKRWDIPRRRGMRKGFCAGAADPNWKGGKKKQDGYILILKPDHRLANCSGYVLEHQLVYEEYHKCCLLPGIVIHHINGVRDDNRPKNLQAVTRSQHISLHQKDGTIPNPYDVACKKVMQILEKFDLPHSLMKEILKELRK